MSEKSAGILPSCGRGAVAVLFLLMASMGPPAVAAAPPPYRYEATHCNNSYYFGLRPGRCTAVPTQYRFVRRQLAQRSRGNSRVIELEDEQRESSND